VETKCAICKRAVEPGTHVQLMFDGSVVCARCIESSWAMRVSDHGEPQGDRG
jgi:hypothetical protein